MRSFTFIEGLAFFTAARLAVEKGHATKAKLRAAANHIRDEARNVLGTYEYGWESLADSTIDKKNMGDSPGLETGKMKRSLRVSVGEHDATIGTDEPRAQYFELGTSRQPPRPWLSEACHRCEEKTKETLGHHTFKTIFEAQYSTDDWSYDGED